MKLYIKSNVDYDVDAKIDFDIGSSKNVQIKDGCEIDVSCSNLKVGFSKTKETSLVGRIFEKIMACLFNLIQVYVLGVEFDEIHSNFECSNFVQTNIYDLKSDNKKNVFIEYESVNLFLDTNVNIGVVKEKPDDLSVKYELDLEEYNRETKTVISDYKSLFVPVFLICIAALIISFIAKNYIVVAIMAALIFLFVYLMNDYCKKVEKYREELISSIQKALKK